MKVYFYLLLLGRFSAVQKALWESLPWIPSAKRMHKFITAAKEAEPNFEIVFYTKEYKCFKTVIPCLPLQGQLG